MFKTAGWILIFVMLGGCASPRLTTDPIKEFDPDNQPVDLPTKVDENQIWDIADHTFFFQVGKLLDLGWTGRKLGNLVGLVGPRQADNVNALDEPVNSSWYTRRHFYEPMTLNELALGPGSSPGPDTSGQWVIVDGKFEGGTAGFNILDAQGKFYILKFDSKGNDEMASSAEVIGTKILHAAGYNVPHNSVCYFNPHNLTIGPKARYAGADKIKRKMTEDDLAEILGRITIQPDGTIRCLASEGLSGKILGVFQYHGTKGDDPNDLVDHEHRRELRGLRVLGSWLNDADRRAANTLDVFIPGEDGKGYLKHYLIDMGSTMGSNNMFPHAPKYGNEYLFDPRTMGKSLVALGFYVKPWEHPLPMEYPEIGYFENETFDPASWVPTYPNPAFERCTNRDGYWGAKLVMAFTDDDIATIVGTAQYSDSGATRKLTELLIERRDMIGRYWFDRANPLDHFVLADGSLTFTDLAIKGNLETAESSGYRYRLFTADGSTVYNWKMLPGHLNTEIEVESDLIADQFYFYEFQTRRQSGGWGRFIRVYFFVHGGGTLQLVRIERQE